MNGADGMETVMRAALVDRCDHCLKPRATDQDWDTIAPGEGEHLCWAEWPSTCDEPPGDLVAHLAQALRDAGYGDVAAVKAEALRDAADAMPRRALGDVASHWRAHAWSNWLRDRADVEADR